MTLLPKWAKRVPVEKVKRLYELDAQLIEDEALLDEVAYGLYARCESIVTVTNAMIQGSFPCPACSKTLTRNARDHNPESILACDCGWEAKWGEYHSTFAKKQLFGYNALDAFTQFLSEFPQKHCYADKLRSVDLLLHQFHQSLLYSIGRPVVQNLLEGKSGKMAEVITFLDELTYGDTQEDMVQRQYEWRETMIQAPWATRFINTKA